MASRTLLRADTLARFSLVPGELRWPWISFSAGRSAIVYPTGETTVGIRLASRPEDERTIELPTSLRLPDEKQATAGTTSRQPGLHALSVTDDGETVAAFGARDGAMLGVVLGNDGRSETVDLTAVLGTMGPMAALFTESGEHLWLSAEGDAESSLVCLRTRGLELVGQTRFAPPPLPAYHELQCPPGRDEVLLLMACGQDGTFARIARRDDSVVEVDNELSVGAEPTGFVDWDAGGDHVFLVGDAGLEKRSWPALAVRATATPPDGLVDNYSGLRVGRAVIVSAADEESGDEERALVHDAGDLARLDDAPAPPGMWAGRLGAHLLVTVVRARSKTRGAAIHRLRT